MFYISSKQMDVHTSKSYNEFWSVIALSTVGSTKTFHVSHGSSRLTFLWTGKRLLARMQSLVGLQLSTLDKCLPTGGVITQVRPLTWGIKGLQWIHFQLWYGFWTGFPALLNNNYKKKWSTLNCSLVKRLSLVNLSIVNVVQLNPTSLRPSAQYTFLNANNHSNPMLLTCVCSLVGLQGLFPGENPVADVTADMAGGGLPLGDQLLDRVGTWPAAPDTILGRKEITYVIIGLVPWP